MTLSNDLSFIIDLFDDALDIYGDLSEEFKSDVLVYIKDIIELVGEYGPSLLEDSLELKDVFASLL